jgi:anti-sigma B factor antagonist
MDSGITINPSLDISTRTVGGITIAELAVELDIASAPALREQLLSLLRPGSSRILIDLSKVSLCDASGLAVLVGIGRRARLLGGFLRLAAVSPQASRSPAACHSSTGAVAEITTRLRLVLDARRWPILGGD